MADDSVNSSDSEDDPIADTKDDLIAGKKARLKKSLSSCSTWLKMKLKTEMTESTQRTCRSRSFVSMGHNSESKS